MSDVKERVAEIRDQITQIRRARSAAEACRSSALERARSGEAALRAAHEARVAERQQLLAKSAMKVRDALVPLPPSLQSAFSIIRHLYRVPQLMTPIPHKHQFPHPPTHPPAHLITHPQTQPHLLAGRGAGQLGRVCAALSRRGVRGGHAGTPGWGAGHV